VLTRVDERAGTYETRPSTRPITIRQLLTHTSGIGYTWSDPGLALVQRKANPKEDELPLVHEPGEKWTYGSSTRVLGDVIEKISGQRIDAYLQARILGPLGMRDTFFEVPRDRYGRVVTTHQKANGRFTETPNPATLPVSLRADGGLLSTAGDYGRFLRMLLNGGSLGPARILTPGTMQQVRQNQVGAIRVRQQPSATPNLSRPFPLGVGRDTWGLGFQLAGTPTSPDARSEGSMAWAGIYNTEFWVDPARGIGAILLMQTLPFYDDTAIAVLQGFESRVNRHLR
jgi:CubicO group peptidase (beta-lactamase class C family)